MTGDEQTRPVDNGAGPAASTAAPSVPVYPYSIQNGRWPVLLTGTEFWTFVRLAAYDWRSDRTVTVSVAKLSSWLGQTPATTARHLQTLQENGLIVRISSGSGSRPATYRIMVPRHARAR